MHSNRRSIFVVFTLAGLAFLLAMPSPACADGGPILTDPDLWAMIDEGQQIAVVHLQQDGTASVDLFISMADHSGQSHQVTFFLPLGVQAASFQVVEGTSRAFDQALTEPIEEQLTATRRNDATYRGVVQASLLLGSLVTNGAWMVAVPLLLSGCGGEGPAPVATFETASSQVAIYDMNAETDLQALIETTGLDPKVKETLAALEGQQIAVVKLQTQPLTAQEESTPGSEPKGQPGIHLSWRSTLVSHSASATYAYPLGTGKAWASPIELTRVYVVSPPALDFHVEYPRLGVDLSGLTGTRYGGLVEQVRWKIDDADGSAFAVDEAYGDFGHIWRATYVKSNSGQDLVVTLLPGMSREVQRAIRAGKVQGMALRLTWLISLLVGVGAWVTAWRVVMPGRLRVPYRWRGRMLYRDALAWAVVYSIMNSVTLPAGLVAVELGYWLMTKGNANCLGVASVVGLPLMLIPLGLANAWLFARLKAEGLEVTRGRAFGAYMLTVLMANALYLTFAAGYAAIVAAI